MIRLYFYYFFFFFNDTATTEIYTLSLHDALPIFPFTLTTQSRTESRHHREPDAGETKRRGRSEEHTSELQSLAYLVCRLLLEKKKKKKHTNPPPHINSKPYSLHEATLTAESCALD